jgi:hypothetical protein
MQPRQEKQTMTVSITNKNFEEIKKKLTVTGKLDREDFSSGKEMGMFMDFYNNEIDKRNEKDLDRHVTDVSTYLANIMNRKTFLLQNKGKGIITTKEE